MLDKIMQSELLVELSTEEQHLVVGGQSPPYIVSVGGPGIADSTGDVVGPGGAAILDSEGNVIYAVDGEAKTKGADYIPPTLNIVGEPGLRVVLPTSSP